MTKRMFAIFGLAALAMGLFASTAFASSALSVQVKDVDAAARKPFQTSGSSITAPDQQITFQDVVTVPGNQRLVIENVSGSCDHVTLVYLDAVSQGAEVGIVILPRSFYSQTTSPDSIPVRLYVNPGDTLRFGVQNGSGQSGSCYLAVAGYYVNLP